MCRACEWFYAQDRCRMFLEQNKRRKFPSVPTRIVHARVHVRVISGSINSINTQFFSRAGTAAERKSLTANPKSDYIIYCMVYSVVEM